MQICSEILFWFSAVIVFFELLLVLCFYICTPGGSSTKRIASHNLLDYLRGKFLWEFHVVDLPRPFFFAKCYFYLPSVFSFIEGIVSFAVIFFVAVVFFFCPNRFLFAVGFVFCRGYFSFRFKPFPFAASILLPLEFLFCRELFSVALACYFLAVTILSNRYEAHL